MTTPTKALEPGLPELPEQATIYTQVYGVPVKVQGYTSGQLRAYALAAIKADRKRAPVSAGLTTTEVLELAARFDSSTSDDVNLKQPEIVEFARALSRLRLPEGWVSVKDRLPTHIYSVLGYVTDGPLTRNGTDPMRDIVSYDPDRGVWLQCVGDDDAVVTVSHWQDLPAAPNEVQAKPMPKEG